MFNAIFRPSAVKEDLIDNAKQAFDAGEMEQACRHLSKAKRDAKLMQKKKAEYYDLVVQIGNATTEIKRSVEDNATMTRQDIASNAKRLDDNLNLLIEINSFGFFNEADLKETAHKVQEYFENLLRHFNDPRNASKKPEFVKAEKAVCGVLKTLSELNVRYGRGLQIEKFLSLHENFKQYYTNALLETVETDLKTPINVDAIVSNIRTLPDRLNKLRLHLSKGDYDAIEDLVYNYFYQVFVYFKQNAAQISRFMQIEESLLSFLARYPKQGYNRVTFGRYYAENSLEKIESELNVFMDDESISRNVEMLFEQMSAIEIAEKYVYIDKTDDVVEKIIAYFKSVFQYIGNNDSNLKERVLIYLEKLARLEVKFKLLYVSVVHQRILNSMDAPIDIHNVFETLYNTAQKIATHLQTLKDNPKEGDYDQLIQKIIKYFNDFLLYINQIKNRKEFVFTNGIISSLKKMQEVDRRFKAVVDQFTDALHKILVPLLEEQERKTSQLISELRAQEIFHDKSIAPLISSYVFAEVINRETQKTKKPEEAKKPEEIKSLIIALKVENKFYDIAMKHQNFLLKVLDEVDEIMRKKECSVSELLNDLIKCSNMKKFSENHPLRDKRNSSERAVGVDGFIRFKLNELESRDSASPEYFKMLQEFEEFFESKKDVIQEFDRSNYLISAYEKIKKKAKRYINDLEEKLAVAWSNLKNQDANSVIIVIEILDLIKKHNALYVEAGLSNPEFSMQETLNDYLGDNGHFHQYLLEVNKTISESAVEVVFSFFYELLPILTGFVNKGFDSRLTFTEHETLNFEKLHEKLVQKIEQAERLQIKALKRYCGEEDRTSFIASYHQVKELRVTSSETINSELEHISRLMLNKVTSDSIKSMVATALMSSQKSLKEMAKSELQSYFECLSKIKTDVTIFAFFGQRMDAGTAYNQKILFETYVRQVKAFEEILEDDAKTTKNYRELHERFSLIRNVFMEQEEKTVMEKRREIKQEYLLENTSHHHITLSEESDPQDIHQPLKDFIDQYEQKYFMQGLIAECNQYAEMSVKDYSEKLQEFIRFLEGFGTEYQVIYNHLITSLTKNILASIEANSNNHGWDVLDNLAILEEKKQFIPDAVWEECSEKIAEARIAAKNEQNAEEANVRNKDFSMSALAVRLSRASCGSYRSFIRGAYTAVVAESKEEIDRLLNSDNPDDFYIAIKELDSQWENIKLSRMLNNLTDLTHLEDVAVKHISHRFQHIFSKIPTPLTEDQSSFDVIQKAYVKIKSFLYLCGSEKSKHKGSLADTLWTHETSKEPLELLQRIIDFYATLIAKFHQNLTEKNYDNVLRIRKLLQDNDVQIRAFSRLISDYSHELIDLNIQCREIKVENWDNLAQGIPSVYLEAVRKSLSDFLEGSIMYEPQSGCNAGKMGAFGHFRLNYQGIKRLRLDVKEFMESELEAMPFESIEAQFEQFADRAKGYYILMKDDAGLLSNTRSNLERGFI